MKYIFLILFLTIFFGSIGLWGQPANSNESNNYHEFEDDPYLPPSTKTKRFSKAFEIVTDNFFCTQVNVSATGANILNDAANEPSLAVNPINSAEMVIGWRQFDNINSNFRQAGYGFTTDGGLTWTYPEPIESGIFRSDPVLLADENGKFYYNSLTLVDNDIFCHTFISEDIGDWDEGTYAFGGDKQWMALGKTTTGDPRIYLTWSPSFSICEGSFTQSLDGGETYTECEDAQFDTFLGTINVGRDNNLYAAGWHRNNVNVRISDNSNDSLVWEISRTVNLKGTLAVRNGPNPDGLLGQVDIDTDIKSIEDQNFVYVLSSVVPLAGSDPCDLMFARSTDGGRSFQEAIRINTDNSSANFQWFGTMSVAPNGRIDVVWLDTRDHPGTFLSSLYYSYSEDHGTTWSENQKLTESFDPHVGWPRQNKMGDYFDMTSSDEGAHLAWCGTFNGEQDVYYGFITPAEITTSVTNVHALDNLIHLKILPNPSRGLPLLETSSLLSLDLEVSLTDVHGALLSKGVVKAQGDFQVSLANTLQLTSPLKSGVYFVRISSKNHGQTIKRIVII